MTQMMVAIATGQAGHCATNLVETARSTAQDHARTLHQATVATTVHGLAATRRFPSAMTDLAKVCSCRRHASLFFFSLKGAKLPFFSVSKKKKIIITALLYSTGKEVSFEWSHHRFFFTGKSTNYTIWPHKCLWGLG